MAEVLVSKLYIKVDQWISRFLVGHYDESDPFRSHHQKSDPNSGWIEQTARFFLFLLTYRYQAVKRALFVRLILSLSDYLT